MFQTTTPESMGVSSKNILSFIKTLEEYGLCTHSIIMTKGNNILTECYYKPIDEKFNHRMYSISKSFVSVAVGMAITEGLLTLEDKLVSFFPEYRNENTDELYEETSIRDMLTMSSNVASFVDWWGIYDDRIKSYYANKSTQIPGTMFFYDSVGSYVLGCVIEKLTGKTFLDYLKEKVLLEIGFSKESHTIFTPEGHTFGDSGVVCTSRDLLLFARLVMNLGEYNGKQYIDRDYMKQAISNQTDNDIDCGFAIWRKCGYGYLIWQAPNNGFAFVGMGDQLAICDTKNDFIFVITSDNQIDPATSITLIYHELYKTVINNIENKPLPENPDEYNNLIEHTKKCYLVTQRGKIHSKWEEFVNGKKYILNENPMGIKYFKLCLNNDGGVFEFENSGGIRYLKFGLCKNVTDKFPDDERISNIASKYEKGQYNCATSAAWTFENKFVIKSQIIDTFFGSLNIQLAFKDNRVTVLMKKSGQYMLEKLDGYAIGIVE